MMMMMMTMLMFFVHNNQTELLNVTSTCGTAYWLTTLTADHLTHSKSLFVELTCQYLLTSK